MSRVTLASQHTLQNLPTYLPTNLVHHQQEITKTHTLCLTFQHKMKLSIFAAAIITTTTARAMTLPPSHSHSLLEARSVPCWTNSIESTTTATSPLVSDCQALSTSNLAEPWTPTEANNFSFDVRSGTCGFRAVFNRDGGSLPASEVSISADHVSLALDHAVEYLASDEGRVQAKGTFFCLLAGMVSKTGWTNWEIYTV